MPLPPSNMVENAMMRMAVRFPIWLKGKVFFGPM
jgi:hypothetical protein